MKKRTIAIIITITVLLAMLPVSVAQAASGPAALSSVTGSSLTDSATYTISTQAELAKLATLVNGGEDCSGNYLIMTNDITVTNDYDSTTDGNWTPIGNNTAQFKGSFYGQNYMIAGLDIQSRYYGGLFGYIGVGGVVSDLTTDGDGYGTHGGRFSNGTGSGAIAGESYGTILNCTNYMSYTDTLPHTGGDFCTEVGGIAGVNVGIIRSCRNFGSIAGEYWTSPQMGDARFGGITGTCYENAQIIDCCNYGNISASENAGGIAGCTYEGSSVVIRNCCNTKGPETATGSITANNVCGGIIGTLNSGAKLMNCYSTGTITTTGTFWVGAAVGVLWPGSEAGNCFWLDGAYSTGIGEIQSGSTEADSVAFTGTDTLTVPIAGKTSMLTVLNAYVSGNSDYLLRSWVSSAYYPELYGVKILSSPASASTTEGKMVNFKVLASGKDLTYKWQVLATDSGAVWTDVPENGTSPIYTTPTMTAGMDGYKYHCAVTSGTGTVNTYAATLRLNSAPKITKQPKDCVAASGNTFEFTVEATGVPAPSYKWYYSTNNGVDWNEDGCTDKTLEKFMSSSYDGRVYECVVSNEIGSVISDTVKLYLPAAPHIVVQPGNKTTAAGNKAMFSVTAAGHPDPAYQWQVCKDGSAWNNVITGTGGDTANYTTEAVSADMNGYKYRCKATNSEGNDISSEATLTVNFAPHISAQPGNQIVKAGNAATFSVTATGNPIPACQWQVCKDGVAWNSVTTGTGGDTASYTTEAASAGMNGYKYRCVATNSEGNDISDAASLTVAYETVYTITADSSNTAYGSVSGGGSYLKDASVTLTATSNKGYYFAGWYKGTALVSAGAVYTFTASENASYTAQFDKIGIPATITASSSAYNKITVRWSPVAGAKGYYIYRSTSADGTYKKIGTSKKASYVNSGVTTGVTYYYRVAAYTKAYTGKYYSAVASTASALGRVMKVTAKSSNPTKAVIKWKAVTGAKKYQVLRSDTKDGVYTAVKTTSSKTITDSGLIPGNTYYYKVVAYRGSAYSADSDIVSVTTKAAR